MTATKNRKVEIFTAGCSVCDDTVNLVKSLACDSCEVEVLDMKQAEVAKRAKGYGVRSVPAVVIDGKLPDCCKGGGCDPDVLRAAGLGQAV